MFAKSWQAWPKTLRPVGEPGGGEAPADEPMDRDALAAAMQRRFTEMLERGSDADLERLAKWLEIPWRSEMQPSAGSRQLAPPQEPTPAR